MDNTTVSSLDLDHPVQQNFVLKGKVDRLKSSQQEPLSQFNALAKQNLVLQDKVDSLESSMDSLENRLQELLRQFSVVVTAALQENQELKSAVWDRQGDPLSLADYLEYDD